MNQSLSQESLNYIESVFSLSIPTPSPPLSYSFTNLIPQINFNKLKIKKLIQSEDKIIPELHLTFLERFPALSMINENKYSIISSENGKIFTSIFILQSICPPFLEYGEYFDTEVLRILIDLLQYSRKLAPQYSFLCNRSFGFLYEKCIKHSQLCSLITNITRYFQKADEYPIEWFDLHILCLRNILTQILTKPNPQFLLLSSTLVTTIAPRFACLETGWTEQNEILSELYDLIYQFSQNFPEKFPEFSQNQNYLDLKQGLIKIGLELNRTTDVLFKQYLSIIIQSIQGPLFSEDEINLKIQPISIKEKSLENIEKLSLEILEKQSQSTNNNDDQKLKTDSYSPPKIDSIYQMLISTNHSIFKFHEYLFSCLSNQALVSLIKLVISEGQNLILNGNILLQTFLFYELSNLKDLSEISAFVKQKNKKSIFFTDTLFNPAITIFNHPESKIHSVRAAIYNVFNGMVNQSTASFFIPILTDYLNKFIPYPEIFSEFCYFTAPSLCGNNHAPSSQTVVLDCLSHALQYQYESKFLNLPFYREFQVLTFVMLDKYIESIKNQKPEDFFVSSFLSEIIFLIFDNTISDLIFNLIEKYFLIFHNIRDQLRIDTLIAEILPVLDFCIANVNLCNQKCARLLAILFDFLGSLQSSNIESLKKTQFFDKIRSFVYLKGVSVDLLAYALIIEHFAPERHSDTEWKQLAETIGALEMTETMYKAILILLSYNNEPFVNIGNQNAIFLIPAILKSKFCLDFLKKMHEVLNNSIPDQILFSELGIAQYVINILNEDTSDEIWKSVLDILQITFANYTRRNDLLAFFRLFSPIDDHTLTKHMQELLDIVPLLIAKEQFSNYRSIIRFTTRSGFIRIPVIPCKRMNYGFTISFRIMLSNFQKPTDSIRLFKFSVGEAFIKAMLYQNRIVLSSPFYNKDISLELTIPTNKWIVLSISFAYHPDDIAVFINGKSMKFVSSVLENGWPDALNKNNVLFGGEGQGFVECHFNKAAIFANSSPFSFPDLSNDESLRASYLSTLFLFDSEMSIKGQIQNLVQMPNQNYEYVGQLFSSISPFISTFYYTKGVSFIVSLFSLIDYDIPSNTNDKQQYTNSMYFYQLFELVNILIQMSDFAQQKLLDISAFEVIAHFMNNSEKTSMNFDVSSRILAIQPTIRNKNLRSSFVRSILLNFPLWTNAPVSTLKELFKAWRYSTKLIPDALSKELRPPVILNVLMKLYETNRINDEIREILFEILIEALNIECHSSDLAMIISVMHINQNNPDEIINYLEMLNQLVTKCPTKISLILHAFSTTEWIALYPNKNVKSILIRYFMKKDLIILIQYILKNIEQASNSEESVNDSSLLECCCTFTGIKSESLLDIVQNFPSASLNSLNDNIFPILLGYALYASESACEQLSKLLYYVFSQKEGVDIIVQDSSRFSLFLLVSFLLLKSQNRIDFIVELVSSNPTVFSNTLKMIDLFSYITFIEYHHVQTNIVLRLIRSMFKPSFKCDVNQYFDILINFICFHMRIKKKEESQAGEITFHKVLEKCRKKSINSLQYSFFMLKAGENWVDFQLVQQLLTLIPADKKVEDDKVLILLSLLCHPQISSKETNICQLLNKFVSIISPDTKSWIPVIYQVSKHPKDFESANDFLNTFKQKIKQSTELYENFTNYFTDFVTKFVYVSPFSNESGDIGNAIRQNLVFDSTNETKTETAIIELRKNIKDIQHGFESCWNKLHLRLSYQKSPFYKEKGVDFYKRGNYFDYKLRPSILVRTIPKKGIDTKEDLMQISTNDDKEESYNNYYDNVFKSRSEESELYHCRCIQVGINKMIGGTFYFTNAGFRFVTDSFKVKSINASSITHFFWAASPIESKSSEINSIQIFLKNKHCFLFTFPNDDVTKLISKGYINRGFMGSIRFFQENEPDLELDRLQLIRKWEVLEISNFDYILWLNILSGRSFLNKNAYPVFPKVFVDDNENRQIINYSKSNESNGNENVEFESKQMIGHCLGAFEPFKSAVKADDCDQISIEIPPELYINELFLSEKNEDNKHSINVPKWSSSKVDFLYDMRQTLESSNISNQIHLWIDKIFGNSKKQDNKNPCLPVRLFSNPHPSRKFLDKSHISKVNYIRLSGLSNLQTIDFNIRGQSFNTANIFALIADGSIIKSSIDSLSSTEKLDISIPNSSRVTSSSQYLFCTRGSNFIVFSFEKRKIIHFNSAPIVAKVTKLATCDDYIAAGGSDGSVVIWNLAPETTATTATNSNSITNNSASNNTPIPLKRKRGSATRSFSAIRRTSSKDSITSLDSFSLDSNNSGNNSSAFQSGLESDDDHEHFTSSSIFDLNVDAKNSSPLAASSINSPPLFSQSDPLSCHLLLAHHLPICSLQISSLFGLVISADSSGLVCLSLIPDLELCRTVHVEGSTLKSAIITEGYGAVVVLSKKHESGETCLSSFSLNGDLMKQIVFDKEKPAVVDICGVVGTVSGFDYLAVADTNNDISIYDACSLVKMNDVYHFNEPIKKIKYSQTLSLLMVFFEGTSNPPAIVSYIMH